MSLEIAQELHNTSDLFVKEANKIWKRYHHLLLGPPMLYNVGWLTMCTYDIILICLVRILVISVAHNILP